MVATMSRRSMLGNSVLTAAAGFAALGLTGCGGGGGGGGKVGTSLAEITDLAKKEGRLQLIAYPEAWANYKGHFAAFKAKYGITISVSNPDGSSAQELQAVASLKGQKTEPDVLDIGNSFTDVARQKKLITPFKPSTYDAVPAALKDPDGWWVGAYYGVISIGVNTKLVDNLPRTFDDLLRPEYKGKVLMLGDPRQGASDYAAVTAAAIANGGSAADIGPGIDYFAKLKKSGNVVQGTSMTSALSTGNAAIAFNWNYNFVGALPQFQQSGVELQQVVPADGVFGTFYAQPITVQCPQPNAARLWVEWLTSDEGSEQYALGGAIPARFEELSKAGKLSQQALATLPAQEDIAKISFPTTEDGTRGAALLVEQWGPKVSGA